jgi:hypothetical protein
MDTKSTLKSRKIHKSTLKSMESSQINVAVFPRPKRGVGAFADRFPVLRELNTHDSKRGGSRLHARKVRGKWHHNAHQRGGIAARRLRRKTQNDPKKVWFSGTGVGNGKGITMDFRFPPWGLWPCWIGAYLCRISKARESPETYRPPFPGFKKSEEKKRAYAMLVW